MGKRSYGGILNIGLRPTFQGRAFKRAEPTIEVHIFNFNKSIYGKDLELVFVKKIRNERKFESASDLRRQIQKDQKRAGKILKLW